MPLIKSNNKKSMIMKSVCTKIPTAMRYLIEMLQTIKAIKVGECQIDLKQTKAINIS